MFFGEYYNSLPQIEDPRKDLPLASISVFSERMLSLVLRNKLKILDMEDFAKIYGSLEFLRGLEYHYDNFLKHLQTLASRDCLVDDSMLDHEAVAYLHRLGQFYYFAKGLDLLHYCPKIKVLYLFRRKIIGHRSIDAPFKEDSVHARTLQAGCFLRRSFRGYLELGSDPSDEMRDDRTFLKTERYLSKKMHVSYQIINADSCSTFILQKDHSRN